MRRGTQPWLKLQLGDDGHVIRRLLPVPALAQNPRRREMRLEALDHPNMVEPPPPVGLFPVAGPVAPPSVKPLFRRNEMAQRIDPRPRRMHDAELFDLDWRVANNGKQGLVIPNV